MLQWLRGQLPDFVLSTLATLILKVPGSIVLKGATGDSANQS